MTQSREKLQDVFNACAGKIVFAPQFEELLMENLASKLTREEMREIDDTALVPYMPDINKLVGNQQLLDTLAQAVGDGTIGLYIASADGFPLPFVHVKYLELLTSFAASTSYADSVIEAYAAALEQCVDQKDEMKVALKNGEAKGVKTTDVPKR